MADKSLGLPGRSRPAYPKRESGLGDQFMHWLNPAMYRERRTDDISAYTQEMKEYAAQKEREALAAFDSGQKLTNAQRRGLGVETAAQQVSGRRRRDDIWRPTPDTPFGVPYPGEVEPLDYTQDDIPQIRRPEDQPQVAEGDRTILDSNYMDPSTFGPMPPQLGQDGAAVEGIPRTSSTSPTERARNSRAFGEQQNARSSAQAFLNTSPDIQEAFHAEQFGFEPPAIQTLAKGAIGIGPRGEVLAENPETPEVKSLNEQYERIYGAQQPNHYVIQNEVGQLESVPVPNSPADPKVITRTRAEEILDGRAEGEKRRNADSAVFERISALTTSLLNNPDLEDVIGGFSGSFLGQVVPRMASWLPHERERVEGKINWADGKKKGTGNAQALADIEALRNVSEMKGLRDLKGGGVSPGPVTEREWPKMGSLVANLVKSQHSGTFRDIIVQLNEMAASALGDIDTTFESSFALPRPQDVTSEQWENMSNEDKTEYWTNIMGKN